MKTPVVVFVAMLAVFAGFKAYAQKPVTTVPVKVVEPVPYHFMVLPPVEYDHYYDGDLTIKVVESMAELRSLCKNEAPQLLACSTRNARSCLIVMIHDAVMRRAGWNS